MLPLFRLRSIALALLHLLPEHVRPAARRRLARLRYVLFPMTRRQMLVIRNSGLWDPEWFEARHPDLATRRPFQRNLLRMFIQQGNKLRIQPHPLFDTAWYLSQNPDIADLGINALFHYLTMGHLEGRQPNELFSDHWYRNRYPDVLEFQGSGLQHYLQFGDREGRDPHALIQSHWYRDQLAAAERARNVLSHYLNGGESAGLRPNPWFDPFHFGRQLANLHADRPAPACLLAYFASHGLEDGLDPSSDFSVLEYCERHPEILDQGVNPLVHFLASGKVSLRSRENLDLTAEEWVALFGHLTEHEHASLAAIFPHHGYGKVAVFHPPGHEPAVLPSRFGHLEIRMFEIGESFDAFPYYDAMVVAWRCDALKEDALQVGLDWLSRQPENVLYFDDLVKPEGEPATLNFKPDWSPARFKAGALSTPVLMAASNERHHSLLDISATPAFLHERNPDHLPLIAGQIGSTGAFCSTAIIPRPADAMVSIIIPTRDQLHYLRACVSSIMDHTEYPAWEIILIDNGSEDPQTLAWLLEIAQAPNISVHRWAKPFNFSELCNVGASLARGELLCLLNNDIEVTQSDWLQQLANAAMEPDCGAAGALLLYPDGRIQSAGVLMGPGGVAANRYATVHPDDIRKGELRHLHEVSAVAGACLVTRKDVYKELGGLNEMQLGVAFNDVDYCLRLRRLGLYCRLAPGVQLIHHESVSLKDHALGRKQAFAREVAWMQENWPSEIARDPFHNLNLRLSKFHPTEPHFGNRRHLLWPSFGVAATTPPCPSRSHPPLRWYIDENQKRVAEVTQARRAIQLAGPIERQGLAVLILTKDRPEYIIPLLDQLIAAAPRFSEQQLQFRVIIGDTGTTTAEVLSMYNRLPECCQLVTGLEYQFSRCNNLLLNDAKDFSTVLFLNNDIRFDDAATSLLALYTAVHASDSTGIVGAVLQFPDGTVQHEGIAAFCDDPLRGFVYHPGSHGPVTLHPGEKRQCLAVTGALLMIRQETLRVCGGFDESYAAECQDVDLCLAAARGGYSSVLLNAGVITHFENGTRTPGEENWADRRRLMRRWHNWIEGHWL